MTRQLCEESSVTTCKYCKTVVRFPWILFRLNRVSSSNFFFAISISPALHWALSNFPCVSWTGKARTVFQIYLTHTRLSGTTPHPFTCWLCYCWCYLGCICPHCSLGMLLARWCRAAFHPVKSSLHCCVCQLTLPSLTWDCMCILVKAWCESCWSSLPACQAGSLWWLFLTCLPLPSVQCYPQNYKGAFSHVIHVRYYLCKVSFKKKKSAIIYSP